MDNEPGTLDLVAAFSFVENIVVSSAGKNWLDNSECLTMKNPAWTFLQTRFAMKSLLVPKTCHGLQNMSSKRC